MGNPYNQLTLTERYQIEALKELDYSARKIAEQLKRSNKTISREIKRCSPGDYCAEAADQDAITRRQTAPKAHKKNSDVTEQVKAWLNNKFSPEQIAGRMRLESYTGTISYQTIYRMVAQNNWKEHLPRKGKRYRQRAGSEAGAHLIPNRVDIDKRPASVDDKEEVGHWEGDTVYGQDSYLVTLSERVSKLTLALRVRNKTKTIVAQAIQKMLKPHRDICDTITFDNGGEFAGHASIARALDCKIYFAKPYSSWQRGLNENSNGLLRRFFPKGMKIGSVTKKEIEHAVDLINIRPRKTLNYLSPLEFLAGKCVSLIV